MSTRLNPRLKSNWAQNSGHSSRGGWFVRARSNPTGEPTSSSKPPQSVILRPTRRNTQVSKFQNPPTLAVVGQPVVYLMHQRICIPKLKERVQSWLNLKHLKKLSIWEKVELPGRPQSDMMDLLLHFCWLNTWEIWFPLVKRTYTRAHTHSSSPPACFLISISFFHTHTYTHTSFIGSLASKGSVCKTGQHFHRYPCCQV